ncbi:MAG: GAF domain-containing protein [Planctomycetaceae bacterium]|jgi:CheY-like chemotaxis protein|nr:GAF domain-containing protein [Planctomycetaceae bacterium]
MTNNASKNPADSVHVQEQKVLENIPTALVWVGTDQKILWCNRQFRDWCDTDNLINNRFYIPLGRPELRGPDFCPFETIRRTHKPSFTVLCQKNPGRFLNMSTTPVLGNNNDIVNFVVELRDVTDQYQEEVFKIKLREAGKELADITQNDVSKLSAIERINILRAKITKYAKEILKYDIIEIRIASRREPALLEPLLALGMTDTAVKRRLYAKQEGNGITGWVAYHGKSYLMEDPMEDSFYIEGIPGAQCSITVPLLYHGKVIGTFNVESRQRNAFNESDLRRLEIYAADVAYAIHTLELISFEEKDIAFRSIETLYCDIYAPLNLTLGECTASQQTLLECAVVSENPTVEELQAVIDNLREKIGEGLRTIQSNTRNIQSVFQKHVATITPELPRQESEIDCNVYEMLRNKRILMIDADESLGPHLSRLLFYYGCTVEAVADGGNALKMLETTRYDAFICNVKIPDMSAYTFYETVCAVLRLKFVPFIYMTGYGHDGGHVMTRAKTAGVKGYIFKPFKLPQLLSNLKLVINIAEEENKTER